MGVFIIIGEPDAHEHSATRAAQYMSMILGMSLANFTILHVAVGLIGIGSGLVVLAGLILRKRLDVWTNLFLATTIATSVTGFFFPFERLLPSHIVGLLSLAVLGLALFARGARHLEGPWLRAFAISSCVALYLNAFVLIAQLFNKVPALKAMAPTQSESPFVLAEGGLLLLFGTLGTIAARKAASKVALTA